MQLQLENQQVVVTGGSKGIGLAYADVFAAEGCQVHIAARNAQQLEAAGLRVDYVELVAPHSLEPLQQVQGLALLATAVHCGSSRLIDHCFLMSRLPIVAIAPLSRYLKFLRSLPCVNCEICCATNFACCRATGAIIG